MMYSNYKFRCEIWKIKGGKWYAYLVQDRGQKLRATSRRTRGWISRAAALDTATTATMLLRYIILYYYIRRTRYINPPATCYHIGSSERNCHRPNIINTGDWCRTIPLLLLLRYRGTQHRGGHIIIIIIRTSGRTRDGFASAAGGNSRARHTVRRRRRCDSDGARGTTHGTGSGVRAAGLHAVLRSAAAAAGPVVGRRCAEETVGRGRCTRRRRCAIGEKRREWSRPSRVLL